MRRMHRQHRPMSEINVVPYVDVMLVLLVIFMITAPLLTQGVVVDLPKGKAASIEQQAQVPIVVSVDRQGLFYVNTAERSDEPLNDKQLQLHVAARLARNPKRKVLVRADKKVDYGAVMAAMVLLQHAGAPSVGLVTETPEQPMG